MFHACRCAACSAALRELPATPRRRRRPPRTRAARPHESMRRARPPPRLHRHGLGLSLLTPCLHLRWHWGSPLPTSAPGLGPPLPTSAPGLGAPPACFCAGIGEHPFHICAGTKWAYRSQPCRPRTGLTFPQPHLRWDWAHPSHICAGTKWARRRHSLRFAVRNGALSEVLTGVIQRYPGAHPHTNLPPVSTR